MQNGSTRLLALVALAGAAVGASTAHAIDIMLFGHMTSDSMASPPQLPLPAFALAAACGLGLVLLVGHIRGQIARQTQACRQRAASGQELQTSPPPKAFLAEIAEIDAAWSENALRLASENRALVLERDKLLQAVQMAEQDNRHLIETFYSASHDLKGPVNTISALLGIVLEDYPLQLPRGAIEHISNSIMLLERTRNLVADIMRYVTCISARPDIDQEIDLEAMLVAIRNEIPEQFPEDGLTLRVGQLPAIRGHRQSVRTLLRHLTDNAFKFANREEPQIFISTEVCDDGDEILVHVTDNGIGIRKDYFEKIFQPFVRLNTFEEYPGSGLGLPQCRAIARQHGWTLDLQSEVGKGSIFTLHIRKGDNS